MNLTEFVRSGRRPGAMYFDNTPAGRFSLHFAAVRVSRTAAERASDAIKARARRLARR